MKRALIAFTCEMNRIHLINPQLTYQEIETFMVEYFKTVEGVNLLR